jgi:predicted DCC family thiol-disulfide oxidoreductase YuxK
MRSLTVLYDASCGLCRTVRRWLAQEPQFVELRFVPAGSDEARRQFPDIDHAATLRDVTVISDGGEVFLGPGAWLICLWALRDYREWSQRLADPQIRPQIRGIVEWVALNRLRLGGAATEPCDDACRR